ncbi:MAG: hypothetical protein JXR52_07180 [Bacteroidales bacterium]|nr:hypothetical protein [Bacteroidales bacterium]MBN2698593.1 hypothetical protein [Bacteroidales bacterium]
MSKYEPGRRNVKLSKKEAHRFKDLGDMGEFLAELLLGENGFEDIRNLNGDVTNFPFADFYAVKDGVEYIITVKTRNRYENSGKINSRYKLGDTDAKLRKVLSEPAFSDYRKCIPAWMAISMEAKTFDAYWGLISELTNRRGIAMTETARKRYICLAKAHPHPFNYKDFLNVYET